MDSAEAVFGEQWQPRAWRDQREGFSPPCASSARSPGRPDADSAHGLAGPRRRAPASWRAVSRRSPCRLPVGNECELAEAWPKEDQQGSFRRVAPRARAPRQPGACPARQRSRPAAAGASRRAAPQARGAPRPPAHAPPAALAVMQGYLLISGLGTCCWPIVPPGPV